MEVLKGQAAEFGKQLAVVQAPANAPSTVPAGEPVTGLPGELSDAEWLAILSQDAPEETPGSLPQDKELFSDHHIRYLVKGRVSFASQPPLLTADTGKVFRIVKYPKWLKEAGPDRICVEGYVRQRDNTSELAIVKLLPPDTLENLSPSSTTLNLQRDPVLLAQSGGGYVLGSVGWGLAHDENGALLKDPAGNLVSIWQSGVKVDASLLEEAYFVKKTALKPVRYGDHGMLMFKFKPGGVKSADGSAVRALVVSLDAYYSDPEKMVYSPVEALRGKYLVYYSIQTAERYSELKFSYNEFNMSTELVLMPYPLLLSRDQRQRLLENAILKATDNNKGEMYSLLYNSCANSALSLINSALPDGKKVKAGWLPEIVYRTQSSFPDAMVAVLLKKGLAGKPLPDVTTANFREYFSFR